MSVRLSRLLSVLITVPWVMTVALTGAASAAGQPGDRITTNATYHNDAGVPGADPHVFFDEDSGYYYAYTTKGADPGYRFGIYRSPDLVTWEHVPGGALDMDDGTQWGHDWFWAPEVYHNSETDLYYLFYSARMNENVAEYFRHPDFEEPSKLGVAVAESPRGPFRNITDQPIDYRPYDPDYHDVNQIMGPEQKKPPETLAEGRTAPLGTYIPSIDPNVFFDDNGRIYLYFSRNAYRNWVWDRERDKYIETSNIYAVELTTEWWHDPTGRTMPTVRPRYVNANKDPQDPPDVRKDGFTPILNYRSDKQDWENAHVNDYRESGGELKDRRWEEGSTVVKRYRKVDGKRVPVYYLLYSANHYKSSEYGVGYAVSDSPLGPWRKSDDNPILRQDPRLPMYSTGHGDAVRSPDGSELYYVHHGRPSPTSDRRLYTERMRFLPEQPDVSGAASLTIDQSVGDEPIPSGVAPYSLTTDTSLIDVGGREPTELRWTVSSAAGAALDLSNPLNRVAVTLGPSSSVAVDSGADGATVSGDQAGVTALTLRYQRRRANGDHVGVDNIFAAGTAGERHEPVATTIPVAGCTSTITGTRTAELRVDQGVTCLKGATVTGPVHVAPGASLVAVGSTIAGPVRARDAGSVWLSDTVVSGPVDIRGASELVRLDGATITGQVSVTASPAAITIARSVVHGSVTLRGNLGERAINVGGNTIDGLLKCSDNASRPTDVLHPNSEPPSSSGRCGKV